MQGCLYKYMIVPYTGHPSEDIYPDWGRHMSKLQKCVLLWDKVHFVAT